MKGSFIFASNLHSFLTTAEGFAFERRKIWEHTHFFYGFRKPQKQLESKPLLFPADVALVLHKPCMKLGSLLWSWVVLHVNTSLELWVCPSEAFLHHKTAKWEINPTVTDALETSITSAHSCACICKQGAAALGCYCYPVNNQGKLLL